MLVTIALTNEQVLCLCKPRFSRVTLLARAEAKIVMQEGVVGVQESTCIGASPIREFLRGRLSLFYHLERRRNLPPTRQSGYGT